MRGNSRAGNAFVVMFILLAFSLAAAALFIVGVVRGMPLDYTGASGVVLAAFLWLTYLAGLRATRLQSEEDDADRAWFDESMRRHRGR